MNKFPFDYWNDLQDWQASLSGIKKIKFKDKNIIFPGPPQVTATPQNGKLTIPEPTAGLEPGTYTPFELLVATTFNNNYRSAINFIEYFYLNSEIPYIRIGTDYYKLITRKDRYGIPRRILKVWKKDEIKQDHRGTDVIYNVHQFDDFTIEPDNLNYSSIHDNCYNLYDPFAHTPHPEPCTIHDIPVTYSLIQHIFGTGKHLPIGIQYLQCLYQLPKQFLPILTLVSTERQTGKTTFLNWMEMLFGDNYVQINPDSLTANFNSGYATKNVIALDESVIDKSHAVEKLKSIVTAKTMQVNEKFISTYSVPFFGKVILCTNKEKDFMRIDKEEIRFFVRKIQPISKLNTRMEDQLCAEIPKFLSWLNTLPPVDTSRSRMVFTAEELESDELTAVKLHSYSNLHKELIELITEVFYEKPHLTSFYATNSQMKEKWFERDHKVSRSYLSQVLKDEMGYKESKPCRRLKFGDEDTTSKGRFYQFFKKDFVTDDDEAEVAELKFDENSTEKLPF